MNISITMLQWSSSVYFAVLLANLSLQVILSGATVTVGTSSQWADEGSNHSITCTPSEAISFLRWYKSSTTEEFNNAIQILKLYVVTGFVQFNSSVDQSHYSFDKSASDFPLTVNGVSFHDEVRYWCEVEPSNGDPNKHDKTTFEVRRKPSSIDLTHVEKDNGVEAEVIVGENYFECSVPNIKPAANFTWRLGSVEKHSYKNRNEANEDPRFVNSYSILTVDVTENSQLTCSAQNKQDGSTTPDQTIRITLNTREEPTMDSSIPSSPPSNPPTVGNSTGGLALVWKIVIGACVAAVIILIAIVIICCCCCNN